MIAANKEMDVGLYLPGGVGAETVHYHAEITLPVLSVRATPTKHGTHWYVSLDLPKYESTKITR